MNELLNSLPPKIVIVIGRHYGIYGFHAKVIPYGSSNTRGHWDESSHGHTSEEAIENAIIRFQNQNRKEEEIYEADAFAPRQ